MFERMTTMIMAFMINIRMRLNKVFSPCEGSMTCGEAEGFAGTKLTLANLLDGNFILFCVLDAIITL